MRLNEWDYIGDGVYVKPENWGVWLHANDHKNPTDRIYLEWRVFRALENGINQLFKEAKNHDRRPEKL